ncbi:MAG: S16 family serine protease [Candidatus Diapherotrites archaeon]|nr:hypothetical protein [Candidatus Micrarchaeota archaeon]MBU1939295.1 hypothetical protein [Candidatus Micrarchaeota archaeon]
MRKFIPAILLVLAFALFFSATVCAAVLENGSMKIYAVTSDGKGLASGLNLEITSGNGKVWSSVEPLVGTTTQNAERIAVEVAKNYSGEVMNHDYKFSIESDASLVEGPSAGAAMALLVISMLQGNELPNDLSITGTISRQGNVGTVGGVFEKTKEASQTGIKLFMIPRGEAKQTVKVENIVRSINLLEFAPQEWGITVVEVGTIDDVLKYAFSDLENIDVNVTPATTFLDFVPEPITYEPNSEQMKELTNSYLERTTELLNNARNSLSTTLIEDGSTVNLLLDVLKDSEEGLQMAEILNDQNYLYSAANYTFLARANAMLVKDISENPSLMTPESTAFELKVSDLKRRVKALKEDLDGYVPVDYLEWHISAQQRISYAELNLQKLDSTRTIVMGDADEAKIAEIQRVQDYEFAVAWYEIAEDFYRISNSSKKKVVPGDVFKESADELIIAAENGLSSIEEAESEDILRRINAAKLEKQNGWYLAAAYDAATAHALIVGIAAVKDKDLQTLHAELSDMAVALDNNLAASENSFVWSHLYLDHAKYYLASADFYSENSRNVAAVSSLKNGISLAYISAQLFSVSDSMLSYYTALPESEYIVEEPLTAGEMQEPQDNTMLFALLGLLIVIVAVLVIVLIRVYSKREQGVDMGKEISRLRALQGGISEGKYGTEIAQLEKLRTERSAYTLELDRMKSEMSSFRQRLTDLQRHFREGVLSAPEYSKAMREYQRHINELQKGILDEKTLLDDVAKEAKRKVLRKK